MDKKFNWCFIGTGRISFKVAEEVSRSPNCRVYSAWNRTYSKAVDFKERFNAVIYEDVEDALNDPNVDGVYIALTNDQHFEYMKKCIMHHKAILCEKPFTTNKKEAEEIFKLAKENNVYVSEAMWTWNNKIAYLVKDYLNEIGQIKEATCLFSFIGVSKDYTVERLANPQLLGGALMDIGVYGIRYTLELFGYPKGIKCHGLLSNGVDLNEEVIFDYIDFKVEHRFAIDSDFGINYVIKGEKGTINIPIFNATREVELIKDEKIVVYDNSDLYGNQFENVAKEIKEGLLESRIITKENTLKCMEIMDECRKQMHLVFPNEK